MFAGVPAGSAALCARGPAHLHFLQSLAQVAFQLVHEHVALLQLRLDPRLRQRRPATAQRAERRRAARGRGGSDVVHLKVRIRVRRREEPRGRRRRARATAAAAGTVVWPRRRLGRCGRRGFVVIVRQVGHHQPRPARAGLGCGLAPLRVLRGVGTHA